MTWDDDLIQNLYVYKIADGSVVFRHRTYKKLAYRLTARRGEPYVSQGKKARRARKHHGESWYWTHANMPQEFVNTLVILAWPGWSPDDMG